MEAVDNLLLLLLHLCTTLSMVGIDMIKTNLGWWLSGLMVWVNSKFLVSVAVAEPIGRGLGCIFGTIADMLLDSSTGMVSSFLSTLVLALVVLQGMIEDIEEWSRMVQGKYNFTCDKWGVESSVNWDRWKKF